MFAIEAYNISKKYRISNSPGSILSSFGYKRNKHDFYALRDISLKINPGEAVGIIGRNGSGKSTLLKVLGGITKPASGSVTINGTHTTVLEAGTGFHKDLSGYHNIFIFGQILGMKKSFIQEKINLITGFAETGDFLHTPLKHYSSGMISRLAFSTAIFLTTDILLLDEILSFGDVGFHHRAVKKIKEHNEAGRTIILVSHNLNDIINVCNRIIVLRNGEMIDDGIPSEIIPGYIEEILLSKHRMEKISGNTFSKKQIHNPCDSPGPGEIKLINMYFSNSDGNEQVIFPLDKQIEIYFEVESLSLSEWDFGIIVRDIAENVLFTSTLKDNIQPTTTINHIIKGKYTLPANFFNIGTFFIYPFFMNALTKSFIPVKDYLAFRTVYDKPGSHSLSKLVGPVRVSIKWELTEP